MATYVISPGAWRAGSGLHPPVAGNSPLHPPVSGSSPLHPPVLGFSPLHPPVSGASPLHPPVIANSPLHPPVHRGRGQTSVEAVNADGMPWRGTDPDWVYQGGPRALLAQALERTHSKIVRPSDPRVVPSVPGVMRGPAQGPNTGAPLWRWGSEFRVQAVLADVAWRLRVDKTMLKLTSTSAISFSLDPATAAYGRTSDQINKVQRAAIEREDRLPEILSQSDDLWSFFRVVLGINSSASPILEEVLSVAWQWATPLVMSLKNEVAAFRPVQIAPSILPVIATPAHGSLPSGHATMAALTAEILAQLLFKGDPKHARVKQLDRLARRIAFNRVVAGVHFPVDSAVGYGLGLQLAGHFVGWAKGQPAFARFDFDPTKHPELTETGKRKTLRPEIQADGKSESLALMWNAAVREAQRGAP